MRAVLVDLDSTICNTQHRHHLINRDGPTDWEAYSMACDEDTVIEPVRKLLTMIFARDVLFLFVSGRNVCALGKTVKWLDDHEVLYDAVYLRPRKNVMSNEEFKEHMLKTIIKRYTRMYEDFEVELAIDDYLPTREMYERNGIPCLIVNPCYVESPMACI